MFDFADLTEKFPKNIDLPRLRAELEALEGEQWLSHYDVNLADGWTTIPLVSKDGSATGPESQRVGTWGEYKRTKFVDQLPYFKELLDTFDCPHGRIRIMKLMPDSIIRMHRDTFEEVSDYAFGQVRLHIPIITNDKVKFTVDDKDYHLKEGRLYYVNFSKKHYVRNDGKEPRTHLVLDLKVNDFLDGIFPKLTYFQRLECLFARNTYPIFIWRTQRFKNKSITLFWRWYNGSIAQKLKHKLANRNSAQ